MDRISRWATVGGGMQIGALAYNVFALSTLLYVAQLEDVPEHILRLEKEQVVKMFPGPGNWIAAEDCWYLKESFGFRKSAQPLCIIARAAKLRLSTLGCHFGVKHVQPRHLCRGREDSITSRAHALQRSIRSSEHIDRIVCWGKWYKHNYCKVLVENRQWCRSKGITPFSIFATLHETPVMLWDDKEMRKTKSDFQKEASTALKQSLAPAAVERIRETG